MKFTVQLVSFIIMIIIIILYSLLYFYNKFVKNIIDTFLNVNQCNNNIRRPYGQGWINLGDDNRITGEQLYNIENSVLQINNNTDIDKSNIINSPIDTIYGINKNIEKKKENALLQLNILYLDLDNDMLNRTIMKPGTLPVLP